MVRATVQELVAWAELVELVELVELAELVELVVAYLVGMIVLMLY
jgi:hypothetical protein